MAAADTTSVPLRRPGLRERLRRGVDRVARRIEDLGYSTLFTTDHYFGPARSPRRPAIVRSTWRRSASMTAAAAVTTDLRVGCRVFNVDLHHPVVLAKELATLDLLSDGRLEVGLGAGWVAAEYEGLDVTMDRPGVRIARLGEVVDADEGALERRRRRRRRDVRPRPRVQGVCPARCSNRTRRSSSAAGRERILTLAGRMADIVSFNYDNSSGTLGASSVASAGAGRDGSEGGVGTCRRRRSLRRHRARDRRLLRGRRRPPRTARRRDGRTVRRRASRTSTTTPTPSIGSVDTVCDTLRERRERYGFSYVTDRPAQPGRLRPRRGPHGGHLSERSSTFLDDVRALASRHRPWTRGMRWSSTRAHRPGCSS